MKTLEYQTSGLLKTIIVIVISCSFFKSLAQSPDILRMEVRMYVNGKDFRLVHNKIYLSGNYLIEPVNHLKIKSQYTLDKNNQIIPSPDSPDQYIDSVSHYIFSDFNLKKSTEFDLSNPPKVIAQYPQVEKKYGISFSLLSDFELFPQLPQEIPNFHFIKDTAINGFKYKIMEDSTLRLKMNNIDIKRAKIYLNQELPGFPIHPISAKLDKTFNGICNRVVLYDTENNVYLNEWMINKEKDPKIHKLLNDFRTICDHLKESQK